MDVRVRSVIDFLQTPVAQIVLTVTMLFILLVVGYYVVRKFRDQSKEDQLSANDLLTNFREMHDEGDISDAEFRVIKSVLGDQLRQELKDAGGDS
ncbi:MAG: hypothetical protein R3C99_25080 [Pirellulaceae bacterium]|nr:hypothetical protein [Planctomycetales bacterium]MCA9163663.1 hypothetical protein [Planctomycetales bacterium]MCA9205266.1 hypothetical protein [Planctomycetales bacterium]MCA9209481.1 hypothetical protein [Planctomycetales bacterium]MCA9220157.1 hypothetical protein [Planctomycetales bacterium]